MFREFIVSPESEISASMHLRLLKVCFKEKFQNSNNILIYKNNKWNVVSSDYLPEGVDKHEN